MNIFRAQSRRGKVKKVRVSRLFTRNGPQTTTGENTSIPNFIWACKKRRSITGEL